MYTEKVDDETYIDNYANGTRILMRLIDGKWQSCGGVGTQIQSDNYQLVTKLKKQYEKKQKTCPLCGHVTKKKLEPRYDNTRNELWLARMYRDNNMEMLK